MWPTHAVTEKPRNLQYDYSTVEGMNCAAQIGCFLQNGHYFPLVVQHDDGVLVDTNIRLFDKMNLFICVYHVWTLERLHVFVL